MNKYTTLTLEKRDSVGVLTLNVPEKRNAMTPESAAEFLWAIVEIKHSPEIKALIITGSGPVFCAGGDLAMLERMLDQDPDQNRREMGEFYRAYLSVLRVDVPTIAALNGSAIGAGMSLTLGCDIRIASEKAKMGFTFLNLGIHPGMGTTHLLPQIVGSAHAADLVLTGRMISAREALEMGLVSRVVSSERLMDEAMEVALSVVSKAPVGVGMAKRALVRGKLEGLEAALDYEAIAQMTSYASEDMRRSLAAIKKG